jgi:hypothetical protein
MLGRVIETIIDRALVRAVARAARRIDGAP